MTEHNATSEQRGSLKGAVAHVFQDAQKSVTAHRKLSIKLWAIQKQASARGYEEQYNEAFASMLNRVLGIKKSEPAAERVIKFCGQVVEYINTQENPEKDADSDVDMDVDEDSEPTIGSRFIDFLLRHLLRGVDAKNKIVRYRACQLLASTVHSLGEIDDDLFQELRSAFVRRLHDKESSVRVQAVIGLSRLQGTDDADEAEPITELLLNSLQHDSKAEVRRAVLLNVEKSHYNIPYALERARDTDTATRRSVYTRVMSEIGDFRLLSIGMREKILSWGLNDREASVRAAATKAFAVGWLENTGNNVLELLERLDVLNSKIAEQAAKELFATRHDLVKSLNFPDSLWDNLTPETVFLAHTFTAYCHESGSEELLEDRLPEITKLGFYIERYSEFLNEEEDDMVEQEFILEQLMAICSYMDFSDDFGRRKIFNVIRNILSKETLSESLTDRGVCVLRKVSLRERDFCQVVTELMLDFRDQIEPEGDADDSFHSALSEPEDARKARLSSVSVQSEESGAREIKVTLKCLHLAQCMLENIEGALRNNVILISMLEDIIVPSVRSHDAPIRERGLRCLGLCCLLDKALSLENIVLFMHCFNKGHDALQVEAMQIICDILIAHGKAILDVENGIDSEIIKKMMLKGLSGSSFDVQVTAAQSLSKLLMADVIADTDEGEISDAVGEFVSDNKARLRVY